jgi:hypothetical protein
MGTTMTKSTVGAKTAGPAKQYLKTGGKVNPNAKVSAQTTPGSKGVGPTKNAKASAQKVAGSKGVGPTKSPKLTSATPSKMKMGGMKKSGMKRGC